MSLHFPLPRGGEDSTCRLLFRDGSQHSHIALQEGLDDHRNHVLLHVLQKQVDVEGRVDTTDLQKEGGEKREEIREDVKRGRGGDREKGAGVLSAMVGSGSIFKTSGGSRAERIVSSVDECPLAVQTSPMAHPVSVSPNAVSAALRTFHT